MILFLLKWSDIWTRSEFNFLLSSPQRPNSVSSFTGNAFARIPSLYNQESGLFTSNSSVRNAKRKILFLFCGNPYSAALMTLHSILYPRLTNDCKMSAKSLPLCLDGEMIILSTFSKRRYLGFEFISEMSLIISHQRTPFFPSIPNALDLLFATL